MVARRRESRIAPGIGLNPLSIQSPHISPRAPPTLPQVEEGIEKKQRGLRQWRHWTIEIKVWKALAALVIALLLTFWFRVVHQDDEILALVRNEVVANGAGPRSWVGRFVNTNDHALSDVAVTVEFLDNQNHRVGATDAQAAELPYRASIDLQATLPSEAVKMRIYSVQWRMAGRPVLMGPFREPWSFGYLMTDPAIARR